MIHVVIDPPILVEGLGWPDSPAHTVVEAGIAGRFVPVTSPALLADLERLVETPALGGAFGGARRLVRLVAELSLVVEPAGRLHTLPRERDNHLLELARAAAARYLVTRSPGLLGLGSFERTAIVRPAASAF